MTEQQEQNIHESDTGIQAFDVTPHAQPEQQEQQEQQGQAQDTNAYNVIIDQQKAQIDALLAHTERLNAQIAQMVTSGAQFTDAQQTTQTPANAGVQLPPKSLTDDDDYSLEALGKEIGKRENHA